MFRFKPYYKELIHLTLLRSTGYIFVTKYYLNTIFLNNYKF